MQKDTYSVEESKYIKVGLYIALVLLGFLIYAYFPHSEVEKSSQYYNVFARFNRTDGLLVGDKVRMAGVTIGKVIDAKLDDNFKAILTLDIKKGIDIPDDSSASIVSSAIMGNKYIEIEVGGNDNYIPQNGEFEYTQDAMVLEELLDRIIGMGKSNRKTQEQAKEVFNE